MSQIEDLAADIREVDGNHDLGASALAQALSEKGWGKFPRPEGDVIVLGPETFTGAPGTPGEGVVSWKGENYYAAGRAPSSEPLRALKDYKYGERVEVLVRGEWKQGSVHSEARGTGLVSVSIDDAGPQTIGRSDGIRPLN